MLTHRVPHVVVIGGGLAGLSATAEALRAGAKVSLMDKSRLGGNSAKATSGINAVLTPHQFAAGVVDDSIHRFFSDIIKSGQGKTDQKLAHTLSARSADAVRFLEETTGHSYSNVAILGGHSRPRTHRIKSDQDKPAPVGFLTILGLKNYLLSSQWTDQFELLENTKVSNLTLEDEILATGQRHSRVSEIEFEIDSEGQKKSRTMKVDSVVISSGGFSADLGHNGLVQELSSIKCPFTTNGFFATGDLLKIGRQLDVDTIDLNQIQLHPTSFVDPTDPLNSIKFLCPEVFRGVGALLIDATGRRFVDELQTRDSVSRAILKLGSDFTTLRLLKNKKNIETKDGPTTTTTMKGALLMMNAAVRNSVGSATFDFYVSKKLIQEYHNCDEVSHTLGLDTALLKQTLVDYNKAMRHEMEDPFGKEVFPVSYSCEERVYIAYITPAVHYTMGGLAINTEAQILKHGQAITNLFAAGEAAGGVHGANRLGGNGMLESVVFGRIAGSNAAKIGDESLELHPLNTNNSIKMTITENLPIDVGSDFHHLRLSFPSLRQSLKLKFGQKIMLSSSPSHNAIVTIPAMNIEHSPLGYVDTILPMTEKFQSLQEWYSGHPVVVSLLKEANYQETIYTRCTEKEAAVIADIRTDAINLVYQMIQTLKNHPERRIKVTFLAPEGLAVEDLIKYLKNNEWSRVVIDVVRLPIEKFNAPFSTIVSNIQMHPAIAPGYDAVEKMWFAV